METLIEHISKYIDPKPEEIDFLKQSLVKEVYQKKDMIFEAGKVARELYFVSKGCVRLFYWVDGVDKTAFFYTEGQFICAGESFNFGVPAMENYQAVEETELIVFTKSCIDALIKEIPRLEIIARTAVENELIKSQKVIASFVTQSPEARYQSLFDEQKELFQRVPQQYIASYLGVSPETLSRIKKRIYKKERS